MISIEELMEYLQKEDEVIKHFNEQIKDEARYAGYQKERSHNKNLKRIQERKAQALAICYSNFAALKKDSKDNKYFVTKPKRDNWLVRCFKKIFHIKPKDNVITIEFPDVAQLPPDDEEERTEQENKENVIETTSQVVSSADEDIDDADETFEDEELEDDSTDNTSAEDHINNPDIQEEHNEET